MHLNGVMERSRALRGASVVVNASRWHEAFLEPAWQVAAPPWTLRNALVEPLQSFGATLTPPAIRHTTTGPEGISSYAYAYIMRRSLYT